MGVGIAPPSLAGEQALLAKLQLALRQRQDYLLGSDAAGASSWEKAQA
jgi:hypothetical protein